VNCAFLSIHMCRSGSKFGMSMFCALITEFKFRCRGKSGNPDIFYFAKLILNQRQCKTTLLLQYYYK
jgi:hypothetical protein